MATQSTANNVLGLKGGKLKVLRLVNSVKL